MGQQKVTNETTIPAAGRQEGSLLALLQQIANQSAGQLGDLSGLAQGRFAGPSEEDRRLVSQTIGATADIGQRELQRVLGPLLAQMNEGSAGRNIGGSTIESLNKALAGQEMGGRLADLLSGAQAQGAQTLLNLPMQRAELQLGANQTLFNMLTGAANPVIANQLQSRMAQPKTTQTSQMGWQDIMGLAGSLGGLPFGLPMGGGGSGGTQRTTPGGTGGNSGYLYDSFSQGLRK